MMPPNMLIWSEDRIAELTVLHERGLSARQIAVQMSATEVDGVCHDFTRNAICGKTARLKLSPQITPHMTLEQLEARRRTRSEKNVLRQKLIRQAKSSTLPPKPIIKLAPFIGALNIPFAELIPFKKYASNQCRFIAGEPPGPEYFACGNPTPKGSAYCVHCHSTTHYEPGIVLSDEERARRRAAFFRTRKHFSVPDSPPEAVECLGDSNWGDAMQ